MINAAPQRIWPRTSETMPAMTRMAAMMKRIVDNLSSLQSEREFPVLGVSKRGMTEDPSGRRPRDRRIGSAPVAYTSEFPPFYVTVDIVVFTIRDDQLCALAVQRGSEPFQGRWALPGGFVDIDEDLVAVAARELAEETSVSMGETHLEQLASYGAPDRDPRGRTVSVAWLAVLPRGPEPRAGTDAAHAQWRPVDWLLAEGRLAFDHRTILADGRERARAKLEYSALAADFVDDEFTIPELRRVYEVVWGEPLDPGNFHRKVTGARGFVAGTGRRASRGPGRPAEMYRFAGADVLYPPLTRRSFAEPAPNPPTRHLPPDTPGVSGGK